MSREFGDGHNVDFKDRKSLSSVVTVSWAVASREDQISKLKQEVEKLI